MFPSRRANEELAACLTRGQGSADKPVPLRQTSRPSSSLTWLLASTSHAFFFPSFQADKKKKQASYDSKNKGVGCVCVCVCGGGGGVAERKSFKENQGKMSPIFITVIGFLSFFLSSIRK